MLRVHGRIYDLNEIARELIKLDLSVQRRSKA
jgi:hypothetical protein